MGDKIVKFTKWKFGVKSGDLEGYRGTQRSKTGITSSIFIDERTVWFILHLNSIRKRMLKCAGMVVRSGEGAAYRTTLVQWCLNGKFEKRMDRQKYRGRSPGRSRSVLRIITAGAQGFRSLA